MRLTFAGSSVPGRVVAVGRRFPTVSGSFAAADETLLATALNADDPGSAVPSEMWLRAGNADRVAALNVQVTPAALRQHDPQLPRGPLATLRSDPLSRGIRLVLEGAAVLALLLSLAALLLSVAAAVRDDRVALFDLEAQGVGPPTLRSQLRLRAAIVTAVGLVVAMVIGVVLSAATVGLVQVTASATVPVPPLELRLAWPVVLAGLVAVLAGVGAGGGAVDQGRVLGRPAAAGHGGGAVSRAIDVRDVFRIHRTAEGDAAALQGLTLSVEEGEIVVVLGPSGAGKSTLLRILAALEPLSAGTANVYGLDIGSLRGRAAADYRARRLGMIDQHYTRALPPDLRCEEIIGLQLALRGEQRSRRRDRAAALLAAVGLERAATMLPGQLSGGEQQRVAVCAALAHRPQLLLADEPSGELDRRNGDTVYELIRELVRDQGTTAVIVSHDHGATRIADRTVRIRDGRLSEEWRDGRAMLVVGHGGWVHLPEHLRAGLGITSHVQADHEGDGVVLRPAPGTFVAQQQPAPPPAVTAGSEPVAALRQVTKAFGTRSLFAGYDAEFRRGAMTAVIGRSGSGKSTMLAMLAGLERPDAGEVLVLGQQLSRLDRDGLAGLRRSSVAYVGQEPGLVGFLSAEENVTFTLGLRGVTGAAAVDRARESLSQVGLGPRSDQRAGRLSAGERQRAGDRACAGRRSRPAAGGRADVPARPGQRRVGGGAVGRRGGQQVAGGGLRHPRSAADRVRRRGGAPGRRAVDGRGIRARGGRRRGLMWRRLRAGGP